MFRILENDTVISFWMLGILNNMPYVVMIAGAKSISEGGTALVFVSNVLPSLCVKLSAPYWFDKVSYSKRISIASFLMSSSFLTVALFGYLESKHRYYEDISEGGFNFNVFMQLVGVGLCSAQGGLGEASLLALSGRVDNIISSQRSGDVSDDSQNDTVDERQPQIQMEYSNSDRKSLNIAAFSSGTGLAGVCGFLYIFIATKVIHMTLPKTLFMSLIFPIAYWKVYETKLAKYTEPGAIVVNMNESSESSRDESGNNEMHPLSIEEVSDSFLDNPAPSTDECSLDSNDEYDSNSNNSISQMSISERISFTISLWKYMVPLFVVYASEYAMQSGIWTAIGFPVESARARNSFYVASNWIYQLGVFLSRSSGAFFTAPMWLLWLMPLLQTVNLIFFYFVAVYKILYNYVLLLPAFFVGLLGGAVYVSGYQRINKDMPLSLREIALSTSSLADSCGILLADVSGLFIQACIYQHHEIDGALVKCPI